MVLKGNRITLRPFKEDDAKEYLKLSNDLEIKHYLPFASPDNLEECRELIENYSDLDFVNDFYFVIEHNKTNQIIGSLLSFRTLSFSLDTSYLIGENFRGKGYVLEALNLFIDYLSKNTNYKLLEMTIDNKNEASQRIMEKLKAKKTFSFERTSSYQYHIKPAK